VKIERLSAEQFLIKIWEAHSWSVKFNYKIRERVLTVTDEDGMDWRYLGPDPRTTPEDAYTAFLINIDMLPTQTTT
jgi:hypothetical protein